MAHSAQRTEHEYASPHTISEQADNAPEHSNQIGQGTLGCRRVCAGERHPNHIQYVPLVSTNSVSDPISSERVSLPTPPHTQLELIEGLSAETMEEVHEEPDALVESSWGWWNVAKKTMSFAWTVIKLPITIPLDLWRNPWESYLPFNINPVNQFNRCLTSGIDLALGNEPISHRSLLKKLGDIRRPLDDQLERIRQVIGQHSAAPSARAANPDAAVPIPPSAVQIQAQPEQSQEALEQWRIEEAAVRKRFIESTVLFASFRIFNEYILGHQPEDVMGYYNQIINAPNPKEAYLSQLDFIGQLLARIIIPIIEWIMGLILHQKEDKLTGISNIAEQAKLYFANPEVRERELETLLETGSNYFYKLHLILESFANGEADTLSFQEYLRIKLDEDLECTGISRDALYANAHACFLDMINIQSDIPLIGPVVDSLIKAALKPILDHANLIQNGINQGLGSIRPSSGFSYGVMDFIAKRLRQWTAALNTENLSAHVPVDDSAEGIISFFEDPQNLPNKRQQQLLKTFFQRLARYLPFEGVQMEEIPILLEEESHRRAHQNKILEALEQLFIQIIYSILQEFSKPDQQQYLWIEFLKLLQTIYDPTPARSESECEQIQNEAKLSLHEFLDTALAVHFKDEFMKTTKEKESQKAKQLTTLTRTKIQASLEKLAQINESIATRLREANADQIEDGLHTTSLELKELFSNLYNCLTQSFDSIDNELKVEMSWQTEKQFLTSIDLIADIICSINTSSEVILASTRILRIYQQLKDMTSALAPRARDNENSEENNAPPAAAHTMDILPSVSSAQFHEWVLRASSNIQPLKEAEKYILQGHIDDISSFSTSIILLHQDRVKQKTVIEHLQAIPDVIEELRSFNQQLSKRPPDTSINDASRFLNNIYSSIRTVKTSPENTGILGLFIDASRSYVEQISNLPGFPDYFALEDGIGISQPLQELLEQLELMQPIHRDLIGISQEAPASAEEQRRTVQRKAALQHGKKQCIQAIEAAMREISPRVSAIGAMNGANQTQMSQKTTDLCGLLASIDEIAATIENSFVDRDQQRSSHQLLRSAIENLAQFISWQNADRNVIEEALDQILKSSQHALEHHEDGLQKTLDSIETERRKILQTLQHFTARLNEEIAENISEAGEENQLVSELIDAINRAKNQISDPSARKFYPCAEIVKTIQKDYFVYPEVQKLAIKLLQLLNNPIHFEQMLILRGGLSRLMP